MLVLGRFPVTSDFNMTTNKGKDYGVINHMRRYFMTLVLSLPQRVVGSRGKRVAAGRVPTVTPSLVIDLATDEALETQHTADDEKKRQAKYHAIWTTKGKPNGWGTSSMDAWVKAGSPDDWEWPRPADGGTSPSRKKGKGK